MKFINSNVNSTPPFRRKPAEVSITIIFKHKHKESGGATCTSLQRSYLHFTAVLSLITDEKTQDSH